VVHYILGREAVTLQNESREADYCSMKFNGTYTASGVYFQRIYAEGEGKKVYHNNENDNSKIDL